MGKAPAARTVGSLADWQSARRQFGKLRYDSRAAARPRVFGGGASGPPGRYFPVSDGNGNVVALVSSGAAVVERYEWGPFGEAIRGPKATTRRNPLGWSSRYQDAETDLVYFGHRYYAPRLGRWLSRDPIEEEGGINLYAFVLNRPFDLLDRRGDVFYDIDTKKGIHIRDYVDGKPVFYTFEIDTDGNPVFGNAGGVHASQFDPRLARKSIQKILSNPSEIAKFHRVITQRFGEFAPGSRLSNSLRVTGRWLRRAGSALSRGAGVIGTAATVAALASSSSRIAAVAESYGRNLQRGEAAMADLDAIEIAVAVQEATGNYFVTAYALDLLLTD